MTGGISIHIYDPPPPPPMGSGVVLQSYHSNDKNLTLLCFLYIMHIDWVGVVLFIVTGHI
jgi:hypothetical protein